MTPLDKPECNKVEVIDFKDLISDPFQNSSKDNAVLDSIRKAYGSSDSSLGIIVIKNVPGFSRAKESFLPAAHKLAHLPNSYLEESLTQPDSFFNAGWSLGKEKMGDKPDFAKGSYYFNPIVDVPGSCEDRANYPASYPCNIWPDDSVLPDFEQNAKLFGRLLFKVVVQLCKYIDVYSAQNNRMDRKLTSKDEQQLCLYNTLKDTEKVKARLLYYFPLKNESRSLSEKSTEKESEAEDSWIGWHNDSGFLTALAGDMYVDDETGNVLETSPDPAAGLYVMNRSGETVRVDIPKDCMAIQLGECLQIMTGGDLLATPHCVRGVKRSLNSRAARISLACFVDTPPYFPLRCGEGKRDRVLHSGCKNSKVPPLESRWTHDGMTFGDFLQKTFEMYYKWSS